MVARRRAGHLARWRTASGCAFRLEDDSFQLIVRQGDGGVSVKHDGSDDPTASIPALLTRSDDQCIILFREADQMIFLHLFLSG